MKVVIILFYLLISVNSFSQELDYCNYFSLEVSETEYNGNKSKSYNPIIISGKGDRFSKFLKDHHNRFDYILFKNSSKFKVVGNYYPDTIKMRDEFCVNVLNRSEIKNYFQILTPKSLVTWDSRVDTFTIDELMLVASKYFYCDRINKKDTSIQSHICIGINGQREFKSNRDLTLLEAFSFEAIFSYLGKKKDPLFLSQFNSLKRRINKEKKGDFKDFSSYLLEIRTACYKEIQHNSDLKNKLLRYYSRNKNNLNFIIRKD